MKSYTLIALCLLPFFAQAQESDSVAVVRQVDSLVLSAMNLSRQGDETGAFAALESAEKLIIERFGRGSADYAKLCISKGSFYQNRGEISDAEKYYLEAKTIHEQELGMLHPDYAGALHLLGFLCWFSLGDFEKAEAFLLEAVAFQQRTWGNAHPNYAGSLINLAILYSNIGKFVKAETLFLEARQIVLDNQEGPRHTLYKNYLHNLSNLYSYMGDFEKAISINMELLEIIEKTNGKENGHYANILNNIAAAYTMMEQYEISVPLLLEAKLLYEKTIGKEHPKYAETIGNIGATYVTSGSGNEKTEKHLLEAISINEKALGKNSPTQATYVSNLAEFYLEKGDFEKGEPLYIEALGIAEKLYGEEHYYYAIELANYSSFLSKKGDLEKAGALLHQALSIMETAEDNHNLYYANALNQLAQFYSISGEKGKAEASYLKEKGVIEKIIGKESRSYSQCLQNLGTLYLEGGKIKSAAPLLLEIAQLQRSFLTKAVKYMSENELHNFYRTFESSLDLNLSFTGTYNQPGFTGSSYDNTLFHKGFLLLASNKIRHFAAADPALAVDFDELRSCHRRLASVYTLPNSERDSAYVVDLEEQADLLEKSLARRVAGYGDAFRHVSWQVVQAALKPGEAAIEFVRYTFTNPHPTDSILYAALVQLPGATEPAFVSLCEEKQLEKLLFTNGERKADYVNELFSINERGLTALGQNRNTLYELIWQPLERSLNGIKTIYFSPSGLLHRLNLGAIPTQLEPMGGVKEVLFDRYNMVELGSTRQLATPFEQKSAGNQALLLGGIQYDIDSVTIAHTTVDPAHETPAFPDRGITQGIRVDFSNADSTLRGGTWNYLKWTEKEVNSLGQIMKNAQIKVSTLKAYAATEEAFKAIGREEPSPRILHIATHGYFFPDPAEGKIQNTAPQPAFKISDHPMIRSGLILSGANYAWQSGRPLEPGMEDGILTAYEISQMNLSNTELVVLSACETGLGDIQGNEGVFGLQRAFKIAGAKRLIMSLWQVPDFQTQELMTVFYRKWLEENLGVREALKAAQDELRKKDYDPFYWAGFVLLE